MATLANNRPEITSILSFLESIGIECVEKQNISDSFAEHIEVVEGVIYYDYNKVAVVDLLHESGHMALVLKAYRPLFSGNLNKGFKNYTNLISSLSPFDSRVTTIMSCEDSQVTAWAWAVGMHLGLDPNKVITSDAYQGEGDSIRESLALSENSSMPYIGVSMLHHAGYTHKYSRIMKGDSSNTAFYPKMSYWTADQVFEAKNYSLDFKGNAAV